MLLLDFVNSHSNWYELLTKEPYNLIIRNKYNYYLFKYNMLTSDMSNPIVREARGCILYECGYQRYELVCYPFDKFFNIDEPNNDIKIDWSTASVQEKVDGSIVKFWYHNNLWRVSTNGTIDAGDAQVNENLTFEKLIYEALPYSFRFSMLDKNYTYIFELVSPFNQVVLQYPKTELYYLGRRNNKTELEDAEIPSWIIDLGIKYPKRYSLSSKEECKKAVEDLAFQGEGFVVCDAKFNRVKIKSPKYVLLHHSISNIKPTDKFFLESIREGNIDDILSIKPSFISYYEGFNERLNKLKNNINYSWSVCSRTIASRKEFAENAKGYSWNRFLFKKFENNDYSIEEFINSQNIEKIIQWMESD